MNDIKLPRALLGPLPSQLNRAIRLKWREASEALAKVLMPQRIDIRESLCGGIEGCISCVSVYAGVPLDTFIGEPVSVELATDRGERHTISGIITDASEGESDGALATYQLVVRDALSVLERRTNTRVFRQLSVPDIIETLVREWRRKSTTLASAFDIDISALNLSRFPVREQTVQFDESDAHFVRRLCRREGIVWFFRAGPKQIDGGYRGDPTHTLVLFEHAASLRKSALGTAPYAPDAASGQRDAITLLSRGRHQVAGSIRRTSWDHKPTNMDQVEGPTRVDQGKAGNDLGHLLSDSRLDSPHIADSWNDYERIGIARRNAQEARAVSIEGTSGVRDLVVGQWLEITGYRVSEYGQRKDERVVITRIHHRGENNLPKDLHERAQALFAANRWASSDLLPPSVDTPARRTAYDGSVQSRYENTFAGVPLGTPLSPSYDPAVDLPRVHPIVGTVVTREGEEVSCDRLARINVQIMGLAREDHEHAQGAGASGTHTDSAAVRFLTAWGGDTFGAHMVPRRGMEVLLDFVNGDPDKIYVAGVFSNGRNLPTAFSHKGSLPGNRYVSGFKTSEIKAGRYNQLRFDDTQGEISSQLASEHQHGQVNIGYLTHPRVEGAGEPRGEGLEMRTDGHAALRAMRGVYVTAQPQTGAAGKMLERAALQQVIKQLQDIAENLGQASSTHDADDTDSARIAKIATQLEGWDAGTNVGKGSGTGAAAPMIAVDAPAGIVVASQDGLVLGAQSHVDVVSASNTQFSAARRLLMRAGEALSAFASLGMKLITAKGDVQVAAHDGDVVIKAAKRIVLVAGESIVFQAPKIDAQGKERVSVNGGSSCSTWEGGGIEHRTNGAARTHAAAHSMVGPDNVPVRSPARATYQDLISKQSLAMTLRSHADSGHPLAGEPYSLYKEGAKIADGVTDENGQLIIPDHRPETASYTVKLHNGHEFELPVKDELSQEDDVLAAQGYRAAQGDPDHRRRHAQVALGEQASASEEA